MVALLVKKLDCHAKITEIEKKIPSITGLATNSALTAAEDEILNVSNLVKKQIMAQKLLKMKKKLTDDDHDKYITTPEFNNLAERFFTARLAQANLIRKTNFHDKLKSLNQKINTNNTKHLLVENESKKQKKIDSIYFRGKSYFEEDGKQNCLVFQPMCRYFKRVLEFRTGNYIYYWKSKGLSDENIKAPTTSDYGLNPQLSYLVNKARVKFK